MQKFNLKKHKFSGKLIVFEGVDATGKTTLINSTIKYLEQKNIKCCKVPKSVKSYLVSPFWQLSINIDNVSEIVHSCLKGFFINAVYELASYLYHYNKEYSKQLKLNLSSYFKQDIQQITKSLKKSIEPDWAWVSWASNYLHYYDSKEDAEQALIKYRKELYSYDVTNWIQPFQDKLKSDCETMLLSALSPLREQNAQDHGYKRNKTEQAQKLLDHVNKALCIVDSVHPALENNRVII